jgi:hypothetical protein
MLRKALIALVAAAAMGVAFIPTESSAAGRGGGGGFHGGGFHGGFAGRGFAGRGFRGGFFPGVAVGYGLGYYGGPYYAYDPYYGGDGCWHVRRMWTPYGWRWRRHYVCY